MENDIAEVIADIEKVACLINMQGKHTVFVNNQGHVKVIYFELYLGGWKSHADPSLSDEVSYATEYKYFEYEECIKSLKRIRDTLRKVYKNGKIKFENFDYVVEEIKHYKFN